MELIKKTAPLSAKNTKRQSLETYSKRIAESQKQETSAMVVVEKPRFELIKKEQLIVAYSPKAMRSVMRSVNTIAKAKTLRTHSIAKMAKEIGTTKIQALIKVYLIELNDLLNLRRPMTELQIEETASEIVNTFYQLSMADVNLIMKRAKTGQYGEYFETINIAKVMMWFAEYFEDRCSQGATASLDHHSNVKEWNDTERTNVDEAERDQFRHAKTHVEFIRGQKNKQ